jgi:hypothetical protein
LRGATHYLFSAIIFLQSKTQEDNMPQDEKELKEYIKPEIVEELELETRAGSPASSEVDPLDLP